MAKRKPQPKPAPIDLPPDVIPTDCDYPVKGTGISFDDYGKLGIPYELQFFRTERFGWVLTTLLIGSASRDQRARGIDADRFYGITLKGELCRVGKGPHVTAIVRVIPSAANRERLQRYFELYRKGLSDAGQCRDNISTRRARTAARRRLFDWDA